MAWLLKAHPLIEKDIKNKEIVRYSYMVVKNCLTSK